MGRLTRLSVLLLVCALTAVFTACPPVPLRVHVEKLTEFENVIYVSISTGNDENRGVKSEPVQTIQKGIDTAYSYITDSLTDAVDVYVAEGTYEIDASAGGSIMMKPDVSLYGGYSGDFAERDPDTFETTIIDLSTEGGEWNSAVVAENGVTLETVIDGFILQAGQGIDSLALQITRASLTVTNNRISAGSATNYGIAVEVYDNASATIVGNKITGGSSLFRNWGIFLAVDVSAEIDGNDIVGGTAGISIGMLDTNSILIKTNRIDGGQAKTTQGINVGQNSMVTISDNTIFGGIAVNNSNGIMNLSTLVFIERNIVNAGSTENGETFGIHCLSGSRTTIRNNVIFGGSVSASGQANGILFGDSDGAVINNTIAGGTSEWSPAIHLIEGSDPTIRNNILFSVATISGVCIFENDNNNGSAQEIINNTLWDYSGNTTLYESYNTNQYDTMAAVNGLSHASGNWEANPLSDLFKDIDGPDDDIATMEDNDWRLKDGSPVEVRQGGLDGEVRAWGFSDDFTGAARTNLTDGPDDNPTNENAEGWSMGAYEKD